MLRLKVPRVVWSTDEPSSPCSSDCWRGESTRATGWSSLFHDGTARRLHVGVVAVQPGWKGVLCPSMPMESLSARETPVGWLGMYVIGY